MRAQHITIYNISFSKLLTSAIKTKSLYGNSETAEFILKEKQKNLKNEIISDELSISLIPRLPLPLSLSY